MMDIVEHKDKIDQMMSGPTKMNVFDFDGTIFNSPVPNPKLWDRKMVGRLMDQPEKNGLGWFQDTITLSDKCIAQSTFNQDVVADVKKSMADKTVLTVLLTGRTDEYESIIKRILGKEGLVFDEYGLKPTVGNTTTAEFKMGYIKNILDKYPTIDSVEMWDDRTKHLMRFDGFLTKLGVNGGINHIKKIEEYMPEEVEIEIVNYLKEKYKPKILEATEQKEKKRNFVSIVLDDQSRQKLYNAVKAYIPSNWKPYVHHMTIVFGPAKNPLVEDYIQANVDAVIPMTATEIGISDDAIAVKISSDAKTANKIPHITVAVPDGGKPVNSNYIVNWEPLDAPIQLFGKIDIKYS